jgi:hypothetical protein
MADSKINVLILTATITPPVHALNLARIEPKIRLSDYRKALEFYLTYLADGKISHLIDLYIVCWNKKAYNGLLKNICQLIREDIIVGAPERAFRKIVDEQISKIVIAKRFRTLPKIEGIRGIDNQSYQDMKLKFFLRKISNLLIPWLWI